MTCRDNRNTGFFEIDHVVVLHLAGYNHIHTVGFQNRNRFFFKSTALHKDTRYFLILVRIKQKSASHLKVC